MFGRCWSVAAAAVLGASTLAPLPAAADPEVQVFSTMVTEAEVIKAQRGWCAALVAISDAYQTGGYAAAKAKASAVIDAAYGFDYGPIAFKPTYTTGKDTFRSTRAGALAYFVGPDPSIPLFGKNQGFATYRHWKSCEIDDYVIQLFGNTANTMGLVRVTDARGQVGVVEKTWTFVRDMDGQLRIVLHHSSAPFDAR